MRIVIAATLLIAAGSAVGLSSARVQADSASPSVRAAARLKYNPPRDWIRHYLADDRYKLKGGAWKVVSTETDTFYYPAWAPEMLRQPAGIVIGFPSAAAAEEAGYKRSKYPMESPLLGLTGRPIETPPAAPSGSPMGGGFALPTEGLKATVNTKAARRIVLADGKSDTILPSGWTHLRQIYTTPQNARNAGAQVKVDIFGPGRVDPNEVRTNPKAQIIAFGFMEMPGMNAEQIFSPAMVNAMNNRIAQQSSGGNVNSQMAGMRARIGGFGNVRGVIMDIPIPQLGTVPIAFAGKGSKMYLLYDGSRRAKGARQIIGGFRGR